MNRFFFYMKWLLSNPFRLLSILNDAILLVYIHIEPVMSLIEKQNLIWKRLIFLELSKSQKSERYRLQFLHLNASNRSIYQNELLWAGSVCTLSATASLFSSLHTWHRLFDRILSNNKCWVSSWMMVLVGRLIWTLWEKCISTCITLYI